MTKKKIKNHMFHPSIGARKRLSSQLIEFNPEECHLPTIFLTHDILVLLNYKTNKKCANIKASLQLSIAKYLNSPLQS